MRSFATVLGACWVACAAACGGAEVDGAADQAASEVRTQSPLAGVYTAYGTGDWSEGRIHEVLLRDDKTFVLVVRGLFGCARYKGYHCPSSWSDGYTGWTYVSGTWEPKRDAVELQPTDNDASRRESDPVTLTFAPKGKKTTVRGTMAHREISADMDVEARYTAPHSLEVADLGGVWTVTTPYDDEGFHARITGTQIYVKDHVHTVTFDSAARTWDEKRDDERTRKPDGVFTIAGAPDDSGDAVIVLESGSSFDTAVRVKRFGANKMTVDVGDGQILDLERR